MQFDLFLPREAARVYRFPLHRDVNRVSKIVEALITREYRDGQKHWKKTVNEIRCELSAEGLSPASIKREIALLSKAVTRSIRLHEMYCMSARAASIEGTRSGPTGSGGSSPGQGFGGEAPEMRSKGDQPL